MNLEAPRGRDHFWLAATLSLAAWVSAVVLQAFLFGRSSPYGAPYVVQWERYFFHAVFFDLGAVALLSAPFFLVWLLRYDRPVAPRGPRALHALQTGLLTVHLAIEQADHETMRFMGVHLTSSFVGTYVHRHIDGGTLGAALATDAGGSLLPFGLLSVAALFGLWASWRTFRFGGRPRTWALPRSAALAVSILPVASVLGVYAFSGGRHRIQHVSPPLLAIYQDLGATRPRGAPPGLASLVARWQREWQREQGKPGWTFFDREHPLARRWTGAPPPPAEPWNVIYLQLESFRGWNVGHLRPDVGVSPTPTLDALARGPTGAFWTRASSFGPPTTNGFFSGHASLRPHSSPGIPPGWASLSVLSWTEVLRAHGWRAEIFSGCDPDWDRQRAWMSRWYDRIWFHPEDDEMDRAVFRRAARRIRELGASGRPFVATIVSITNHYPFSRAGARGATARDRIRETMRYTDDAIAELVAALSTEPWFARTLLVVTADHGYNLGEHDGTPGQRSLFRESTWVPLVLVGDHPRLVRGRHDEPASLLDIGPTVADLQGITDANPWEGHSLLGPARPRVVTGTRGDDLFADGPGQSVVTFRERVRAFDARRDPLQRAELRARFATEAERLAGIARARARLVDFLIESARVWGAP